MDRLAITDGRIAAVPAPDARRVDLEGRCVLPGFNDAHVHFPTWSLAQRQVRLEGASSLAEAVGRVADALPADGWVRGLGWRDADWTEPPGRAALDAIAPDTPVILTSKDYHSLWLNSAALAHAGGDLDAPGGVVERDARGEPTGVLRENAAWRFRDRHATPTMDEMLEACRTGLRIAATRGVTAIHDKDGWMGSLELFQRLRETDELTMRVWQSIPAERLPHLRELGLRSGFGDDLLRAGYLKVFMDGTLGSATARLLDGSGVEITSAERLAEIVREAAAAGWPVGVHAIGDAANRAALDAFEATAADWRPLGLRQRIEHAQLLDPAELPRFAAIGVAASVQFTHAPVRPRPGRPRLGGARGRVCVRVPARGRRAAGQRLRRAGGGARPAAGHRGGGAAHARRAAGLAARAGADGGGGAARDLRGAGLAGPRRGPPGDARARGSWPIWSCSTAIPSPARPTSYPS